MTYSRVLYEKVAEDVVKISMNRPEKRNAQDFLMLEEIEDAFLQADLDEDIRVIIFAGTGKDFSAGHDMSGNREKARSPVFEKVLATKLTGMEKQLKVEDYIYLKQGLTMRNVNKPSIAMVQGNCIAGGWLTASMCDLIVASEDARFSDPVVSFTPAGVEILVHPYDVGFRKAKELLWTCEAITAQEAKQLGMVSRVYSREKLEEETLALARKIAMNNPVAVSLIKRSINHAWDEMGQRNAWEYHMLIHQLSHSSDEARQWFKKRREDVARGKAVDAIKSQVDRFK